MVPGRQRQPSAGRVNLERWKSGGNAMLLMQVPGLIELHFFFFFNWFVLECNWFKCCVSFYCIAKWISSTYNPLFWIGYPFQYSWASLVAQLVKRICLQCGRSGFIPRVGKIPWRRERLLTPVFWPGESHELYIPWGRKESDTTERLSLHFTLGHLRALSRVLWAVQYVLITYAFYTWYQ